MAKYSYQCPSPLGLLSLIIGEYYEPNNGRELFEVRLLLDERDVTGLYFGSWPYVNGDLENYHALSPDGIWMFVPKESDHFLIHLPSSQKVDLPPLSLSAVNFAGNKFEENFLVIKSKTGDLRIDLAGILPK
jgi:hypothetical protein